MDRFRMYEEKVSRGKIEGLSLMIGDDLLVAIWGGHRPHIGATAIAIPALTDSGSTALSTLVYTVAGHKEEGIARATASKISRALRRKVVVTAGIHFKKITAEEIEEVLRCTGRLTDRLIADNQVLAPDR